MRKALKLQDIAAALGGRLIGSGTLDITRLAHPADILGPGDLVVAMEKNLLKMAKMSALSAKFSAVVIAQENEADGKELPAYIVVERPRVALALLTRLFAVPVTVSPGIHPTAVIEKGAELGANAAVGAFVYVGKNARIGQNAILHPQSYIGENALIGDDLVLFAGAKIGAGTHIGDRALIHFGVSIGGDGFSYVTPQEGSVEAAKASSAGNVSAQNTELMRISSLAPVFIGDDVEIGANSSIDRGTLVSTRIGNGTKIDNQVQIGHNVRIGENCMICGRVGIAGSVTIGDRVVLGGAVGVADHVTIGDDAIAMGMSGIAGNIAARTIVGGIPAMPREKAMESLFNIGRLKNFFKKIEHLAEKVEALEKKQETD